MSAATLVSIHLGAFALGFAGGWLYMAFRRVFERATN